MGLIMLMNLPLLTTTTTVGVKGRDEGEAIRYTHTTHARCSVEEEGGTLHRLPLAWPEQTWGALL